MRRKLTVTISVLCFLCGCSSAATKSVETEDKPLVTQKTQSVQKKPRKPKKVSQRKRIVRSKKAIKKVGGASKDKKPQKKRSLLRRVEQRYASAKSVRIEVKKKLILAMLEKTKKSEGKIFIKGKGRLRFEITKPIKSLVVMDGKGIWVVEYPTDPDFDDTIRVMHSKSSKNLKSQALVSFLLGEGTLLKHYFAKRRKSKGDYVEYVLRPKQKDVDIKKIILRANKEAETILSIKYWDELDNEIHMEFVKTEFDVDLPEDYFQFEPPKNAQVTDI